MNNRLKKHPLVAFYVLAFAISWLGFVPQAAHSHGLVPFGNPFFKSALFYMLGGAGPVLAAIIVANAVSPKDANKTLFGPLLRWRAGIAWYAVALFGNVALWLAAIGLTGRFAFEFAKIGPWLVLIPVFLTNLVKNVSEEIGWRGFALPRLQSRHSALVSGLVMGALSGLWHLPLLLTKGTIMAAYPIIPYFLYIIALNIIYTWLFNNTKGSLLLVTIFHAAGNTVGTFIGMEAAVAGIVAFAIVIAFGPARLARRGTLPETSDYSSSIPSCR